MLSQTMKNNADLFRSLKSELGPRQYLILSNTRLEQLIAIFEQAKNEAAALEKSRVQIVNPAAIDEADNVLIFTPKTEGVYDDLVS